jgi:hypothetical protein
MLGDSYPLLVVKDFTHAFDRCVVPPLFSPRVEPFVGSVPVETTRLDTEHEQSDRTRNRNVSLRSHLAGSEVVGRKRSTVFDRREQRFCFARVQSVTDLLKIALGRERLNGEVVFESIDHGIEVLVVRIQTTFKLVTHGRDDYRRIQYGGQE